MSRVVRNNRGYLHLLATCPSHQRQYLLNTATPEQVHALVQVAHNAACGYLPLSEHDCDNLKRHGKATSFLRSPAVPFKEKKQMLVQEGGGFVQDLIAPLLTTLLLV